MENAIDSTTVGRFKAFSTDETSRISALEKAFQMHSMEPLDALSIRKHIFAHSNLFIEAEKRQALDADFVVHLSPDLSLNCTTFMSVCTENCVARNCLSTLRSNEKNYLDMCGGILTFMKQALVGSQPDD